MSRENSSEITTFANAALGYNTKIELFEQQNYFPILQNAKIMEVSVASSQELMDQPIEKGATITDFTIKKPKVFEVAFVLSAVSYLSDYLLIKQLYENNTYLILQTTVDTYKQLLIQAMPYKENGEMIQSLRISLTLREVQTVEPSYSPAPAEDNTPKQAQLQNTTNRGNVQPKNPSDTQAQKGNSALLNLFG